MAIEMEIIKGKINLNTPDYICIFCPQEYNKECKAFLQTINKKELEQRREKPCALCHLKYKELIPSFFYKYDYLFLQPKNDFSPNYRLELWDKSFSYPSPEELKYWIPNNKGLVILFNDRIEIKFGRIYGNKTQTKINKDKLEKKMKNILPFIKLKLTYLKEPVEVRIINILDKLLG